VFELGVQAFFTVEFRAVAGQVKHLHVRFILDKPGLHGLAVISSSTLNAIN
jgi:hypothetical protein